MSVIAIKLNNYVSISISKYNLVEERRKKKKGEHEMTAYLVMCCS